MYWCSSRNLQQYLKFIATLPRENQECEGCYSSLYDNV